VSTAEEIRASLAPIVDRLIKENPGLARDFKATFPTSDSAIQWVSHELGRLSKQITVAAQGSEAGSASPDAGKIDAYVEKVLAPALAASLEEIDTKSLTEDDIYEALNSALAQISQTAK
jgi:hypothetical protein